jgi:hypothetical protein
MNHEHDYVNCFLFAADPAAPQPGLAASADAPYSAFFL